jgi:hypothetical protein
MSEFLTNLVRRGAGLPPAAALAARPRLLARESSFNRELPTPAEERFGDTDILRESLFERVASTFADAGAVSDGSSSVQAALHSDTEAADASGIPPSNRHEHLSGVPTEIRSPRGPSTAPVRNDSGAGGRNIPVEVASDSTDRESEAKVRRDIPGFADRRPGTSASARVRPLSAPGGRTISTTTAPSQPDAPRHVDVIQEARLAEDASPEGADHPGPSERPAATPAGQSITHDSAGPSHKSPRTTGPSLEAVARLEVPIQTPGWIAHGSAGPEPGRTFGDPSVEVHIGSIEVSAPSVAAHASVPRRPKRGVTGFDDYRAIRRGGGWDSR